jgi:hypothetical protein
MRAAPPSVRRGTNFPAPSRGSAEDADVAQRQECRRSTVKTGFDSFCTLHFGTVAASHQKENPAAGDGRGFRTIGRPGIGGAWWPSKPSKYPPAEPGALVLEPLKAACPCRFSSAPLHSPVCAETIRVSFWLRRFVARTILYNCTFEPLRLKLSWSSVDEIPFRVLGSSRFGVSSMDRGSRPPDMSNFCCLPGRAGGTPILV